MHSQMLWYKYDFFFKNAKNKTGNHSRGEGVNVILRGKPLLITWQFERQTCSFINLLFIILFYLLTYKLVYSNSIMLNKSPTFQQTHSSRGQTGITMRGK